MTKIRESLMDAVDVIVDPGSTLYRKGHWEAFLRKPPVKKVPNKETPEKDMPTRLLKVRLTAGSPSQSNGSELVDILLDPAFVLPGLDVSKPPWQTVQLSSPQAWRITQYGILWMYDNIAAFYPSLGPPSPIPSLIEHPKYFLRELKQQGELQHQIELSHLTVSHPEAVPLGRKQEYRDGIRRFFCHLNLAPGGDVSSYPSLESAHHAYRQAQQAL